MKFSLKVITEISLSGWFGAKSINYGLCGGQNYFCVTQELRIVFIFLKDLTKSRRSKRKRRKKGGYMWTVKVKIFTIWPLTENVCLLTVELEEGKLARSQG